MSIPEQYANLWQHHVHGRQDSDSLPTDVDDAVHHGAGIVQALCDVGMAAKVAQLQQPVGHSLTVGVDECHQIILALRTQDHLCVVLKKIHLHKQNKSTLKSTVNVVIAAIKSQA